LFDDGPVTNGLNASAPHMTPERSWQSPLTNRRRSTSGNPADRGDGPVFRSTAGSPTRTAPRPAVNPKARWCSALGLVRPGSSIR
jgi:hypothetical protein